MDHATLMRLLGYPFMNHILGCDTFFHLCQLRFITLSIGVPCYDFAPSFGPFHSLSYIHSFVTLDFFNYGKHLSSWSNISRDV